MTTIHVPGSKVRAAALRTVRERLLFLEGVSTCSSPAVLKLVEARDRWIDETLAAQQWEPGALGHGSFWPRQAALTLGDFSNKMWYLAIHGDLARGLCDVRSRHCGSQLVAGRIEASLEFLAPVLRIPAAQRNGFYFWDIYNHQQAARALFLGGQNLTGASRQILKEFLETVPSQVFHVTREAGVLNPQSGANMLDILYGLLLRGAAFDDAQWVDAAAAQLPIAMGREPGGQGIQEDWSYHYHGHGINLGYGLSDLESRARWFFLTHATPWQPGPELRDETLGLVREFFRFNLWRGRISPYIIDRSIAMPGGIFGGYHPRDILQMALLAGFDGADANMLASAAREAQPNPCPDVFQAALQEATAPQVDRADEAFSGIRYYPNSEYLVARQPQWFAAIRMSSHRTKAWDTQNQQHIHGSSSAEFSIALMTDGREFDDSTVTTMKWRRLMGVTACDAIEIPPLGYGLSSFVGGLADGQGLGVLGMQYLLAPPGQDMLTGNKSVFITPNALVLLGNDIRCSSPEPVFTTLFHAPVEDGASYRHNGHDIDVSGEAPLSIEPGDTLFLRNVLIRLLEPATLHFSTREGNYAALNDPAHPGFADGATLYRRRWCYLETAHGARPERGRYGAIIWPATASEAVAEECQLKIRAENAHHRLDLLCGRGAEVRFPGDWRKPAGLSYSGVEPFQWGHIARWQPGADADHCELTLVSPQRYGRAPSTATELILPEGFFIENVTLMSMTGAVFPAHLYSTDAHGRPETMTVKKL